MVVEEDSASSSDSELFERGRARDAARKAAQAAKAAKAPSAFVLSLVERFDIEPFPDFSAKSANFTELVLFCIDAKFCKKIFVGKLLTRSTRFTCFCTAQTSIFQKFFVKLFRIFRQNLQNLPIFEKLPLNFGKSLMKFCRNSANMFENVEKS